MQYRPDIDGLRAVAVLPVIAFHAGVPWLGGGFAGVDVFFVISGFLITQILLQEKQAGTFSLAGFYERRARRILPALFVVMLACLPFAYAWLLPLPYQEFAESILAVLFFVSNLLFWRQGGDYFSELAEEKPLLHTWSLAVEEQFYLLFPLLLMLALRFVRKWMVWVFGLAALASFLFANYAAIYHVSFNFYSLPTRAWELLAGAMLATSLNGRTIRPQPLLALLGLGCITLPMLLLREGDPWPSVWTLLPVMGTVLVLAYTGPGGVAYRLLSSRPLVAVGLVSYSAYLWHQPLFAFARVRSVEGLSPEWMALLALAVWPLAALTWFCVERPFRDKKRICRRQLCISLSAAGLLLASVGVHGIATGGLPQRMPPEVAALSQKLEALRQGRCHNFYANTPEKVLIETCRLLPQKKEFDAVLLGDSHLRAAQPALEEIFADAHRNAAVVSGGWCAPLLDFGVVDNPRRNPICRTVMTHALQRLAEMPEVQQVVLIAQWPNYLLGTRWGEKDTARYGFGKEQAQTLADNPRVFAMAFDATLALLTKHGKEVIVVETVPEYRRDVGLIYTRARFFEQPVKLALPRASYQAHNAQWQAILAQMQQRYPQMKIYDPTALLCDAEACRPVSQAGELWYADDNHLTDAGARQAFSAFPALLQ